MADLNTRVDSFITMLLEVSGRARPADLDAHVAVGADELLRAYAAAHGEMNLAFEGDALVVHAPSQVAAAVQPPAAPEPVAEPAPFEPEVGIAAGSTAVVAESVAAVPAPFVFDPNSLPEVDSVQPSPPAGAMASESAPGEPAGLPAIVIPELDAVLPVVEAQPIPEPPLPVISTGVVEPASYGVGPVTTSAPMIPASDDSSFFEFEPEPVAPVPDVVPVAPAETELLFVPQPPVDEGDLGSGEIEPAMPALMPNLSDLSDLPIVESVPSSFPEMIPVDPLEGLDESDGF